MRVILIGFMGVGKTSVGKKLAKKLNFDFIDTDYEIEILAKIYKKRRCSNINRWRYNYY